MPTKVHITLKQLLNACVINMEGSIDANNLHELEDIMNPLLIHPENTLFIMDFTDLHFIDSRVVGYITFLFTTLSHSGRILALISPTEVVDDTLTLVGLKKLIPTYQNLDEALERLR